MSSRMLVFLGDHQFVRYSIIPFGVYSMLLSLDTVAIEALCCEAVLSFAGHTLAFLTSTQHISNTSLALHLTATSKRYVDNSR